MTNSLPKGPIATSNSLCQGFTLHLFTSENFSSCAFPSSVDASYVLPLLDPKILTTLSLTPTSQHPIDYPFEIYPESNQFA